MLLVSLSTFVHIGQRQGHKTGRCRVGLSLCGKQAGDASVQAEWVQSHFQELGLLVLTRGMLVQDKASKKVILSLGHYASAAWGFEVGELSHDVTWEYCPEGLTLDEARDRVHELVVQNLAGPSGVDADEQYCAVPASACLKLRQSDSE